MMLAEDLRQAVLQAALQGKLTKQLETDSNVDEMLINIQAEKKKLIAEKKIKKEKPLPEIQEDEFPYDIPDSWRWVRWGNLAYSIQYGYNASAKEMGRIKMVRISDIQDNSVNWDTVPYCDIKDEEIETYLLQKNDILFARTGGTVGKSFLVNEIQEDVIYAGYLIRTRYSNQLVPQYLKGFMESQLYWVQLQNGKTQGCQPNCNGQTLSKMLIPLPPIEEQQRIVDKINEIMPKIDEYEKIEKELETIKKEFPTNMKDALLQAAMQGKLTEQLESDSSVDELLEAIGQEKEELIAQKKIKKEKAIPDIEEEEIPFDIPENWRWVRLKNITYSGGQKIPNKCFSYIDIGSIDNVHQKLNNEDNIIEADKAPSRARKIVKYGDVLYATVRPYLHNMCIIDRNFKEEPIASTGFAVMTCCKGILNKFLLFYMLSPEFDRYANSTENAKGMAYPAINDDKFYRALIPIPPIEEQQRIAERLEVLLPLCEDLKEV